MTLVPCLHDWNSGGDPTKNEYFLQDLIVARWIFAANPRRHVDIGSRIDGFVGHVASFRDIEMLDVRPVSRAVPGVTFKQMDFMEPLHTDYEGYCDSISCLHAIEHFGLGRYGDPLHPAGYERALANMGRLLSSGGRLYLSTPIGRERVEFNANRVFDPRTIVRCAREHLLDVRGLTVVTRDGTVVDEEPTLDTLSRLADLDYNLGIFTFGKLDR